MEHRDVLTIGAGISGIGVAYYLQRDHPGKTYALLEARDAIGGTWDLFRYPGIRSDSDIQTFGYEFKPWTAEAAKARVVRKAQAEEGFVKEAAGLPGSAEARALLNLLRELTEDGKIVESVGERLYDPPRTVEEIGFYPGSKDNPFERVFRFAVSRLDKAGGLIACEDKYSPEVFELLGQPVAPDELVPGEVLALGAKVEARFATAGTRLCTLWTGGGDHLYFVVVSPETAERWANRVIGRTHQGEPLGLCRPRWDVLLGHLAYAMGWGEEEEREALRGWNPLQWNEPEPR